MASTMKFAVLLAAAFIGSTAAMSYPTAGSNNFPAGGGGACVYDYSTHDGSPVITSASCHITTKDLNKGTEPSTTVRAYVRKLGGHDGCNNDDAGHILANRLGGRAEPTNLFPQSPHLNRGAWEEFERAIAACFDSGASKATLKWSFKYGSASDQRPTSATYSASYDSSCSSAEQSFSNTCDKSSSSSNSMVELLEGEVASAPAVDIDTTKKNASRADLSLSCVSSAGGCVLHDHETDSYELVRNGDGNDNGVAENDTHVLLTVGTQLDVLHLVQPTSNSTYVAPATWCLSEDSHFTASGNFVVVVGGNRGGTGGGSELNCRSHTVDLDVGDCATLSLDNDDSSEKLRMCFHGRAA